MPPFELAYLLVLGGLCLVAAAWDVAKRRIPNLISAAVLVAGLSAQATTGGAMTALGGLGAGAIVFALLFPLWTRGGIGGGDVKLAFAAAAWTGLHNLPVFLLAGALAGGVVAAVCYAVSQRDARGAIRSNLWMAAAERQLPEASATRDGKGRVTVPYAVAIGAGVFAALLIDWAPRF
jgi:Flp pilus assembly protein protease CpaA